jgi:hypothetical protein
LPELLREEHIKNCLNALKAAAIQRNLPALKSWIQHKERNVWILKSLCQPMSTMRKEVWFATPFDTNVGEAAHALSNRAGVDLTLLTAITLGEQIDTAMLESIELISFRGVRATYKGKSQIHRFKENEKRRQKRTEKAKVKAREAAIARNEIAQDEAAQDEAAPGEPGVPGEGVIGEGVDEEGPAEDRPAEDRPAEDRPAGPAEDGPAGPASQDGVLDEQINGLLSAAVNFNLQENEEVEAMNGNNMDELPGKYTAMPEKGILTSA